MTVFDRLAKPPVSSVPPDWNRKKLKFLANVQTSNVDKASLDDEEPVRLCNYTDVYYNDRITGELEFMEATASRAEIEKFALRAGQVIITKDSEGWDDIGIPALVAEDIPGVLCGYHLAIFDPDPSQLDGAFLAWLCRADVLNDQFKLSANGVTRFGLGQYAMKNAIAVFPDLETQRRIATFLDAKTAQLDEVIASKRVLLDRLAEKRQAIICQAITKGLDPTAPMKDSGVEWLGDIPAHWALVPLKWQCSIQSGQVDPREPPYDEMTLIAPDHIESGTGRVLTRKTAAEQGAISGKYLCDPGDVLYSKIRPALRKVAVTSEACLCSADMYAIAPGPGLERDYLFAFLLTDTFTSYAELASMRVAMPKVNREAIGSFPLTKPPVDEQRQIIAMVRDQVCNLDDTEEAIELSIDRLLEYRSALITSAVTGQIERLQ